MSAGIGALVLLLVIVGSWMVRQILTAPLLTECDACGAEPGEPCEWYCTSRPFQDDDELTEAS